MFCCTCFPETFGNTVCNINLLKAKSFKRNMVYCSNFTMVTNSLDTGMFAEIGLRNFVEWFWTKGWERNAKDVVVV